MRIGSVMRRDRSSGPPASGLIDLAGTPLAVALYAAGVLWPIAWLAFNGLGATAVYEESLGYRYFYTLRQLHEGSTYLFLPQGQFTNLILKLVHVALDLAGLPPTQLRPRIDYFYIGAIALIQAINIAAFAYLLRQAPPRSSPVLVAAFWLLPFYAPGSAGQILLSPDYVAAEPAIAMLAAALMIKAYRSWDFTRESALWLGIFLGAALATKITLAVFPGVVVAFLALSTRPLNRGFANAAAAGLTGVAVWLLIVWADLSFGFERLAHQLYDLQGYVRSGGGGIGLPQEPWLLWLWVRASQSSLLSALIYLTPLLGLGAIALARDRKQLMLLVSLLAGAAAYTFVQYQRDYPVTLVEAGFYSFMVFWCVWCTILHPRLATRSGGISPRTHLILRTTAAAVLILFAVVRTHHFAGYNLASIARSTEDEQRLARLTEHVSGRRLWLVPDNDGRPMSVEAAIMKGGSGLSGVWLEPDSALMRRTAPDLDFRFERRDQRPVKLEDYAAVLFMTRSDLKTRLHELNRRYHIDLFRLDCREVTQMATGMAVMCTPKREAVQS